MTMKKINYKNDKGEFETFHQEECEWDEATGEDYASLAYLEAKEHLQREDYKKALVLFRRAVRLSVHYKTLEYIGHCYMKLNAPEKAVEPLLAATAFNRQVHAPLKCAEAFVELGRLGDAMMMINICLEREPRMRKALKLKKQVDEVLRQDDDDQPKNGVDLAAQYADQSTGEILKSTQWQLLSVCQQLGLELIAPYQLEVLDQVIEAAALLPQLGGKRGTLVFNDARYENLTKAIYDAGYSTSEIADFTEVDPVSIQNWIEIFSWWGWNSKSTKPKWFVT